MTDSPPPAPSAPLDGIPRRDGNRRAVVTVSRDLLAHVFGIPEDLRVIGATIDEYRGLARLLVEGDSLPESDPLAIPSELGEPVAYQLEHDGQSWSRVEWRRLI